MNSEPKDERGKRIIEDAEEEQKTVAVEEKQKDEGVKSPKTAAWEWVIIAIICLASIGYWSTHYKKFYKLEPDYHSFEEVARDIWSGQPPSNYKRMPVFPALFGGLAQVLPVEDPYLQSALILSIAFSALALVMLYFFLRRIVGRLAIVPVGFVAMSTLFLDQALLPLVESVMLCLIILTLWLFAKGAKWQYAAAFFAALTRYEISAIIFVIFILNIFSVRSRIFGQRDSEEPEALFQVEWCGWKVFFQHLALAALASSGFIAWMVLSLLSEQGNPYFELMSQMGWPTRPRFVLEAAIEPFRPWVDKYSDNKYRAWMMVLAIAVPCVYGVWVSLRRFAKVSVAILFFVFLYALAQVLFGIGHWRYIYPVLWIPVFYFAVGWADILSRIDRRLFLGGRRRALVIALAIIVTLVGGRILFRSFNSVSQSEGVALRPLYIEEDGEMIPTPPEAELSNNTVYPIFWLIVTGGIFAFGLFWGNKRGILAVILAFLIASTIGYGGSRAIRKHADVYSWRRLNRYYQFFLAGRWLEENLQPGERAAVLQPRETVYGTDLPEEDVVRFASMPADNLEELMDVAEEWGITYIIYTWRGDHDKDEEPWTWVVTQSQKYDVMSVFGVDEDLPGFEFVENLGWIDERSERAPRVFRYIGKPEE